MIPPLTQDIKDYISRYDKKDVLGLILAAPVFSTVDNRFLAAQILGRRVAQKKFPSILEVEEYIFPQKLSLEQASSELTACYKASLMQGTRLVDLTGGMGIDVAYIGKNFDSISYVEPDEDLVRLAQHNFPLMEVPVDSYHHMTAEAYIDANDRYYDWVYIDPSRRISGNRAYSVSDLVPDIVSLYPTLKLLGAQIMIKLSPMQDISACLAYFPEVSDVYCISIDNELKEVVLRIRTRDVAPEVHIHSVLLGKDASTYTKPYGHKTYPAVQEVGTYLYQPDAAIMKADMHGTIAKKYTLTKLHPNTHLFSSDILVHTYPGRIYKVEAKTQLNRKALSPHLASNRAHIISKNFPLSAEEIRKKLRLKDGGDNYLVAYTDHKDEKCVLVTHRLK